MARGKGPRRSERAMWRCPRCGRRFANRNQWHSCVRGSVREHLAGKSPLVLRTYQAFTRAVRSCGPVKLHAVRTRIGYIARMTFAAARLRERWVDVHVVLARRLPSERVRRIESLGGRHVHHVRLFAPEDVDEDLVAWIREAYRVGTQEVL